ncbi:MAG TPA: GIY-YIG nuclease family protein [bacterium]|nr:GIY-YIG nuclease family protein [bacterium]
MEAQTHDRLKERVAAAPLTAGVYFMRDAEQQIIYIGKARRLRLRLQSYLRGDHDRKTVHLLDKIAAIDWQETESEIDALLLESELVRAHQPRYNVRLKDDKRFPYIAVTTAEEFPRVVITRRVAEQRDRYFGPFTDAAAAKRLVVELNKTFRLRRCETMKKRPCLNAQMAVCQSPCAGGVDRARYRADIDRCLTILQGKGRELIRSLRTTMQRLSTDLQFEKAAECRDAIAAVESVLTHRGLFQDAGAGRRLQPSLRPALLALREALALPRLPVRIEAYDIATAAAGRHAGGAKVSMEWGRFSRKNYRLFTIREVAGQDDFAMLAETLRRRLAHAADDPLPDLFLIDGGPGQLSAVQAVLAGRADVPPAVALAK